MFPLVCDAKKGALGKIEFHLLITGPRCQDVKILLKKCSILLGVDLLYKTVIGKQFDGGRDVISNVVNAQYEEERS